MMSMVVAGKRSASARRAVSLSSIEVVARGFVRTFEKYAFRALVTVR